MNTDWQNYLLHNGAHQDASGLFVFETSAAANRQDAAHNFICDLSHYSTVVIAGNDAVSFMQGQFTNDVKLLSGDNSQLSAFCNNKGRMITNFRLFEHEGNHFITLRSDLVEASIEHLQKYVLRANVALQDVSPQLVHLGISGDDAEQLLSPLIAKLNTAVDGVTHDEKYIAIRCSGAVPRYELFCSLEDAKSLWQTVTEKTNAAPAKAANSACWDYLNIVNGLPFIDSSTREEFVPLMANMDLINGVSFTKGCYTGQEIVARTHYLGKQKRRTYRIRIQSETPPEAGQQLATETSTENQYTGTLVTVVATAENEYEALAVIQIRSADTEKLKLKGADAQISLLQLPYDLQDEDVA